VKLVSLEITTVSPADIKTFEKTKRRVINGNNTNEITVNNNNNNNDNDTTVTHQSNVT